MHSLQLGPWLWADAREYVKALDRAFGLRLGSVSSVPNGHVCRAGDRRLNRDAQSRGVLTTPGAQPTPPRPRGATACACWQIESGCVDTTTDTSGPGQSKFVSEVKLQVRYSSHIVKELEQAAVLRSRCSSPRDVFPPTWAPQASRVSRSPKGASTSMTSRFYSLGPEWAGADSDCSARHSSTRSKYSRTGGRQALSLSARNRASGCLALQWLTKLTNPKPGDGTCTVEHKSFFSSQIWSAATLCHSNLRARELQGKKSLQLFWLALLSNNFSSLLSFPFLPLSFCLLR